MTTTTESAAAPPPKRKRGEHKTPRRDWAKYVRDGGGGLLDKVELARLLGEEPRTIDYFRSKGLIPFLKFGHRTIRYDYNRVMAALARLEVRAG